MSIKTCSVNEVLVVQARQLLKCDYEKQEEGITYLIIELLVKIKGSVSVLKCCSILQHIYVSYVVSQILEKV